MPQNICRARSLDGSYPTCKPENLGELRQLPICKRMVKYCYKCESTFLV